MNVPGGSLVVQRHFFGAMLAIGESRRKKMPEIPVAPPAWGRSARHFIKDTRARSRPNRC